MTRIFQALGVVSVLYVKAMLARLDTAYVGIMVTHSALQGDAAWLAFTQPGSAWLGRRRKRLS